MSGLPTTFLAEPCPVCELTMLYRPDGWQIGGPLMCANPACDSNNPRP